MREATIKYDLEMQEGEIYPPRAFIYLNFG
jgi:hypothetical protein